MTARRLSLPTTASWLLAAIACWASFGALTAISARSVAPRVAIAPPLESLALLAASAAVLAAVRRWRSPETWLLCLSGAVLLPWLPFRIPAVLYVWTGALRTWLWLAIGATAAASLLARFVAPIAADHSLVRSIANPRRAPWLAAACAAAMYLGGAWLVYPHLPAGDEPHYLVITQSLLQDHDLKIENNHRRGDYREYFGGELRPDYLRRGTDGEIYSIHPTGLPVIVAPAFAAGGYPAVLVFLALVSGAATAVLWIVVWRLTHDAGATWFAWAAGSLSAPFFFQSFMVYPDAAGSALVMIGLLALTADRDWPPARLAATGVALALLPWLHTRFALLEASLVLLLLAKLMRSDHAFRRAVALGSAPIVSAIAWCAFFYVIYGTPNPAAPYNGYTQSEIGNLARGLPGLLFDAQFGLLPNAPVFLCAIMGGLTLMRRRPALGAATLLLILPYTLAVGMYAMWWAGYSSPARFLVPIALPLAVPIGVWFAALTSRSARLMACGSLLLSILVTATMAWVDRGGLLFNVRDGSSRLLLWLSPLVDVTRGFPSLFQTGPAQATVDAAVWLAAIAMVAAFGRLLDRRRIAAPALATLLGAAAIAAASVALSVVWRARDSQPITAATGGAAFLRAYDPDAGQIAFRYSPSKRLALADVPPLLTLVQATPTARRSDEPLIWAPYLPPGTYQVQARVSRPTIGRVTVTMDREFGPSWSWSLDGVRGWWQHTFTVPVPARVLLVDADAATRPALDEISIRATSVAGRRHRLATEEPWHVVRYGPAVVFLMSGHAYAEPGGTWVGGGETADFVIAPDPGAHISLFVRNAPVKNQVTLESGTWRQFLSLEPREERLIEVPSDPAGMGARLRISAASGARPSDFEQSDDTRLLGCWIETR